MPELPEMENYRTLLNNTIKNKAITNVEINREKSINVSPEAFRKRIQSQKVIAVERRAKHLLFRLENGEVLLLHLMIGGWLYYGDDENRPDRTVQVQLSFSENNLYFIGLRLGYLHIHNKQEIEQELGDLGPELLDPNFSLDQFVELVKAKRGRMKTALVDQGFLAGIGNRYSDEICWDAELLPTRKMDELRNEEVVQLYHSIKNVLQRASEYGGYMDEPFYQGDTRTGGFELYFNVYNREDETCKRCGGTIKREEISSRKTFYCSDCQT